MVGFVLSSSLPCSAHRAAGSLGAVAFLVFVKQAQHLTKLWPYLLRQAATFLGNKHSLLMR